MEQDRRRIGNKEIVNENLPVPKRELNCCGTATPCLAYFLKSRVVDHVYKKRECRQIEIVARTKTCFTRIETIIVNLICCCLLFTKLLKRHPIHFWYVCKCFTAALLTDMKHLLWRSWDVDFADQGMGCHLFLFLGWKIAGKSGQSVGCRRQPAAILNPAFNSQSQLWKHLRWF